jgi:hypothetical protein
LVSVRLLHGECREQAITCFPTRCCAFFYLTAAAALPRRVQVTWPTRWWPQAPLAWRTFACWRAARLRLPSPSRRG